MKLYSCKLRLAGAVTNEVFKVDVTAPEIEIFRHLHGDDAVLNIKETGDVKRSSAEERARLKHTYADPERLNSLQLKIKTEMLRNLFGHDRMPLPDDLGDMVAPPGDEGAEVMAADETPAPVVRCTRVPKPTESFTE